MNCICHVSYLLQFTIAPQFFLDFHVLNTLEHWSYLVNVPLSGDELFSLKCVLCLKYTWNLFLVWGRSYSEKAMAPHSSTLAWKIPWMEEPGGLQSMGLLRVRHDWATSLSLFTFTLHFHALEKEMATHSSVLAWRIPGMEEPGGLLSTGSHRVGHDWSDLAAAAAYWFCRDLPHWLLWSKK